ncbi:hypothetical protein [Capnocytophaga sp.]|uniref:hypothetical protein n=1 Tax=Capnocytophaga sp. TaxID=44737 RepID=UPI0026DCA9CD|nr:hypothetical protein [Capnocytophaga sp.]MDO5104663.1 hypothetical protein [Capnocytophaga sp.]
MIYELPLPKSFEIFENLICDLANHTYKTSNFILYGRKGQNQKGIDIISCELNIIIQCKLRTINLFDRKTKLQFVQEIKRDIGNIFSNGFSPSKIIIATTIQNDTKIQDYLNTLLLTNGIACVIELWSWSKISNEIFLYSNIVNKYYPFRNNSVEIARIEVLNKSIYQKSDKNDRLFIFNNIKDRNQLPVFDFSFINNSDNTITLNSIEGFCETLAVARGGFPPRPNGILKPTKRFLIDFNFNYTDIDKQVIALKDPIFVYPKSPLRIQIQNQKPLINFYKIHFAFLFNNTIINSPELFFNSNFAYSGKIVNKIE